MVTVEDGTLRVGDTLTLSIDAARRNAIRRNHSACHLLQAALREVLGTHVEQAGSYVDAERVRFDFTHFAALTPEELSAVENAVNANILLAEACSTTVTDIATARKEGAMALFGEKYGDSVRMVKIGTRSTELCGGTHVENTGAIGLFRIISESSVAAGTRRIEGTTGLGVLSLLKDANALLHDTARALKAANVSDVIARANALQGELKEAHRALESAEAKLADAKLSSLIDSAKAVGAYRLLTACLEMKTDAARALCDAIKGKYPDMVAVFAVKDADKLGFLACCGADAVKAGAHAGKLVGAVAAITGGKGGGRPDSAMAGGKDASKITEALAAVEALLK